jgi:hypothetical protein
LKPLILATLAVLIPGVIPAEPAKPGVPETEIVDHYLTATREQQASMRGVSMEVEVDASVLKMKKQGRLHALRNISKLGKITYHALGFSGDDTVKKEVIARFLSAETQEHTGPSIAITPENYKFKYKGLEDRDGREVYIFHLTPRKKLIGLFKGEIWIDSATYMPVRESGRLVKTPSIFLKNVDFVRFYDIRDGVAVPSAMISRVEARFYGTVEMSINYTNITKESEADAVAAATSSPIQPH